ncbi:MAG: trypsin-like peptidase domain-containing protein [Kangiellaceae bacterium]|nr:trypsin-like peptidase domain-containing protein [Kangiellaceae bacterium]
MALRITNLIGPMQTQTHFFEFDSKIAIGRDTEQCQVIYPTDFTAVGRKHLVIEEDAGRYELRVNTKNPVYLNGILAEDDIELPDSCTIALGRPDGPSFKVERLIKKDFPKTVNYGQQSELHTKVNKSRKWVKFAVWLIVIMAGVFGYQNWQTQERLDEMNYQAGEIFDDIYRNIDADIGELASQLSSSVYLVILKSESGETPMGTAWVVSSNALATNSHVAQLFNDIPADGSYQFIVRSTVAPYRDHVINRVALHPGYHALAQAWEKAEPKTIDASGNAEAVGYIPGYDVALLFPSSTVGLAKPMPLASKVTLRNLTSGMEVAYVGFPMEGVKKQVFSEPTPTIQVANITSITDFFRGQSPFKDAQMIQHSLPAIGGASGSPIINNRGEVIALLNAGNVVGVNERGERIPNAVAINYAQRVDLLQPLLKYGDNFSIEDLIAEWDDGFARYADNRAVSEIKIKSISTEIKKGWQKHLKVTNPIEAVNQEVTIRKDQQINNVPAVLLEYTAPKTGNYLIMAIDGDEADIDLLMGQVVNRQFKELNRNTKNDFYPNGNLKVQKGTDIAVYILNNQLKDSNEQSSNLRFYIYHD